jgi:hypothetical protein
LTLKAVWDFFAALTRHVQLGSPTVSAEVRAARLATCRANTCGQYRAGWCADCRCVLALKTEWSEQSCPRGLWAAEVDDAGRPPGPPGPRPPCSGCPGG